LILRQNDRAVAPTNTPGTCGPTMTDSPIAAVDELPAREQASASAPLFATVCERVKAANAPRVFVFKNVNELAQLIPQWESLAAASADANVFYEHWMLLPALRTFHSDRDFSFVLVFGPDPERPFGPAILYGFFPFERRSKYRGLPCSVLKLIKHKYMELCTPLVRRDLIAKCVTVLLDWLETGPSNCLLVEFRFLGGEDRATQEILAQLYQRHAVSYQSECSARALFRPAANAETFLNFALTGKRRKEFRRLEKRLSEAGRLGYKTLPSSEDPAPWIEGFLALEAKGWKGQEGSAMALQNDRRLFFEEISSAAHQRGKLMMLGLFLDDHPVALKCNFLTGRGSFAFKIAFDEEFARSSPGMLLEIENVRRLHEMRQLSWMDSCAIPKHFMINRLWPDRRTLETFVISTGNASGSLLVSLLPLLRWVKRRAKSFSGMFQKAIPVKSTNEDQ
jgi:CelD/BcsL family acetyltransferase involved in cellulose biosynthesis